MCRRLALEHGVYVPPSLPSGESWRAVFFELYELRKMWNAHQSADVSELKSNGTDRFKINVFARFRPDDNKTGKGEFK